jgi:hypothetical protein
VATPAVELVGLLQNSRDFSRLSHELRRLSGRGSTGSRRHEGLRRSRGGSRATPSSVDENHGVRVDGDRRRKRRAGAAARRHPCSGRIHCGWPPARAFPLGEGPVVPRPFLERSLIGRSAGRIRLRLHRRGSVVRYGGLWLRRLLRPRVRGLLRMASYSSQRGRLWDCCDDATSHTCVYGQTCCGDTCCPEDTPVCCQPPDGSPKFCCLEEERCDFRERKCVPR